MSKKTDLLFFSYPKKAYKQYLLEQFSKKRTRMHSLLTAKEQIGGN